LQKAQAVVGIVRRYFKDFSGNHFLGHEGVFVYPSLEILPTRIVRQDTAAQVGLQAADHQKYAVIESPLNPLAMFIQQRLSLVFVY
jgi:hypothetical protein